MAQGGQEGQRPPAAMRGLGDQSLATSRGLWGNALREEMLKYNHTAGFVPVAETEPRAENRVEVVDETDQYGLRIPRVVLANDLVVGARGLRG